MTASHHRPAVLLALFLMPALAVGQDPAAKRETLPEPRVVNAKPDPAAEKPKPESPKPEPQSAEDPSRPRELGPKPREQGPDGKMPPLEPVAESQEPIRGPVQQAVADQEAPLKNPWGLWLLLVGGGSLVIVLAWLALRARPKTT